MENEINNEDWQFIAFMIDGDVQHTLGTDPKFAAILLSDPVIVDITDEPNIRSIGVGTTYDELSQTYIPRKPFASWVWDDNVKTWKSPVELPETTVTTGWAWSEEEVNWVAVPMDAANAMSATFVE